MISLTGSKVKCTLGRFRVVQIPRRRFLLRAEPDSKPDPRTFDEGAAQVRRLMQRDRTSFAGPDFEKLMTDQVAEEATEQISAPIEEPGTTEAQTSPPPKPLSPFGSTAKTEAVSPFGTAKKPVMEPEKLSPEMGFDTSMETNEPWWSFVNNITITQIVLACSFILIISLMLGTFTFVLKSGGIHFNE